MDCHPPPVRERTLLPALQLPQFAPWRYPDGQPRLHTYSCRVLQQIVVPLRGRLGNQRGKMSLSSLFLLLLKVYIVSTRYYRNSIRSNKFLVKIVSSRYITNMRNGHAFTLLERIANLLRAEERRLGGELGLQPVHLQVLHYLSRANRYSDTPMSVTDYFALTKGTTSQTVIVLEDRKLIVRKRDTHDGRKVHLQLTRAGKRILSRLMPSGLYKEAQKNLPPGLQTDLEALLRAMQAVGGHRSFGVCHTCHFFKSDAQKYRCGLTGEILTSKDATLICREHLSQ